MIFLFLFVFAQRNGTGRVIDGDKMQGIPTFLWPPSQVIYPMWQIVVVPSGDKSNPLNASWNLNGVDPSSITLAYGRKAYPNQISNITKLSGSETSYDWVPSSSLAEARDYFLILFDSDTPPQFFQDGSLRPIYSGYFAIYKPADLTKIPSGSFRLKTCFFIYALSLI